MAPPLDVDYIPSNEGDALDIPVPSSDYSGDEEEPGSKDGAYLKEEAEAGTSRRLSSPKRRKPDGGTVGEKDRPDNRPLAKRLRKLPVRAKDVETPLSKRLPDGRGGPGSRPRAPARNPDDVIKDSQEEGDDEEQIPSATPVAASGKKIIFGDEAGEEHEEFGTPPEAPPRIGEREEQRDGEDEEDEEDDDDDAPPEAVSTRDAALQSKRSAKTATKAARGYQDSTKRKRKERDALFKKQAEARKRAQAEAAAQPTQSDSESGPKEAPAEVAPERQWKKRKLDIPDVLPAELLESGSEDERDEGEDSAAAGKPAKKRRLTLDAADRRLAREDRPPRDARVGSTVFRVAAAKRDARLAPEVSKIARNAKQRLLVRNRVARNRRSKGFFVNGRSA